MDEHKPVGPIEHLKIEIAMLNTPGMGYNPGALKARLQTIVDALPEDDDFFVAFAQAVDFAIYVEGHAKGAMKDAATKFLSNEYAAQVRERLKQ